MTVLTRYSYKWNKKVKLYLFLSIFGAIAIMALFSAIRAILRLIVESLPQIISNAGTINEAVAAYLVGIFGLLSICVVIGFFIAIFSNVEPDIQISSNGLHIQVFVFWWMFVPWEEVEAIRPTFTSHVLRNSSRIVLVKKLTPVHRFISWCYVLNFKPGFLIRRSIRDFDELLRIIQSNMNR